MDGDRHSSLYPHAVQFLLYFIEYVTTSDTASVNILPPILVTVLQPTQAYRPQTVFFFITPISLCMLMGL